MKIVLPDGPLLEPLPPLQLGFISAEEQNQREIDKRIAAEMSKMELLAEHLGISDGPAKWYQLALELARPVVPGLQEEKPKGRPRKWGNLEQGFLYAEFERLKRAGCSQDEASRALAKKEPWRSFVGSWAPGKATTGSDPAQALLAELKSARKSPLSQIAWEAYLYHEHTDTIAEWEHFVLQAMTKSSGAA